MWKRKVFYVLKKILIFLISVLILSVTVFYISRLTPTDPLQSYYGDRTEKMTVEEKDQARERLGLNDPVSVQYVRWVKDAFHGDFGISYKYKQDVTEVIAQRIGNTLILGGIGFLLTFVGALGLGVLCARFEGRLPDRILCKVGTFISCIPEFWFSLVLILIFCVMLGWLPSSGAYSVGREGEIADRIRHLILPMAAVLSGHLWYYGYMVRNRMLEEVKADYVLLARAKGIGERQILFRHCLRNVLPSYISIMAVSVPHVLGGTYIIETVFSYPGIGTLAYESARYADYNLLMVLCMLTGIVVILCSMIGRVISEQIDPRLSDPRGGERQEVNGL